MFWQQFLLILVLAIIALVVFHVVKPYFFAKFHINRRYIFIALMALLILPMLLPNLYKIPAIEYAHFVIITFGVLVYMETVKIDKQIKNRPVVGRPKAKSDKTKK
jgi:hypothetical protein